MRKLKTVLTVAMLVPAVSSCGMFSSRNAVSDSKVREKTQTQVPVAPEKWRSPSNAAEAKIGWTDSFNDPLLLEFVNEALANNKNLQTAAANVERTRALAAQAGAALKPAVNLSAGATRSGDVKGRRTSNELSAGLQISWEPDVWGRIRAGGRAAAASAEAAQADYLYARHSLAAATIKAYFTAVESGLQADIARENLRILEETLRIVNARYKNGSASLQDASLARSDAAVAREQLKTVEGSRRDGVRALEILLGRYPGAELEVRKSLPDAPPPPPAGVPSELLERRPDIVASERRVAAAFNTVAKTKAARLPSISLTSGVGGASELLSDLLDPVNIIWKLGASFLAPIFDGGSRKAQVEIATAEQKQALAAYGQAALEAFGEVEALLDQGVVLGRREADLKEAAREAGEAHRIAELLYKEGETDLLDLLTVQRRVASAKRDLVSVRRLLLEQRVNLHLALGGNWEN